MNWSAVPWSFVLWALGFMIMLGIVIVAQKRSQRIDRNTQDIAETALPEIGDIAQRAHQEKFGRPSLALDNKAFETNGATRHR